MSKLVLSLLFILAACAPRPGLPPPPDPAFQSPGASWLPGAETRESVFFLGTEGALRYGGIVRVWMMQNRTYAGGRGLRGEKSLRYRAEFDCRARLTRTMQTSAFAEVNATGRALLLDAPAVSAWQPLPPDSIGVRNAVVACGWIGGSGLRD